jgi:hypothetical protein
MTMTYTHFSDLAKEVRPPDRGILSRTLYSDDRLKAVLFGFAQSEELNRPSSTAPSSALEPQYLKPSCMITSGEPALSPRAS